MISSLRNSLKDGGMTTIVWVAVGSMIIGSALPLVMKKSSEEWALRINGVAVPYSTYASELAMIRDYISMVRAQYGQFADYLLQSMGFSDPQTMTMQQLITQQLMVYGYKTQGIVISKEAIAQKLSDSQFVEKTLGDLLPGFLYKDGVIDNNILKLYLQQRGMTVEQLQERIQERIGTVFMQNALEPLAYLPVQSVENAIATHNATKDLAVVRMPLATYSKSVSTEITDEQVKTFYEQENARARRYYTPEKRDGTIWEFDASGYGTSVDAQAVERYYEEHKNSTYQKEPAKVEVRVAAFETQQEAADTRTAIEQGTTTLAEVAQGHPFNEESANNEGLLKPIVRGTGDRVVERAAFILAADGDVSAVLPHENRFVVIERVSKTAPVVTPLSAVRDSIKDQLQNTAFKEACLREMNELIKAGDADALTAFAKTHKATKNSPYAGFVLSDAKTDAQKALFTLEPGSYTALNSAGKCYLVHLRTITPSALQSYDVVASQVRADLVDYRARQALSQAYIDFNHAIAAQGIRDAAREYGFTVTDYTYKGSSDTVQTTELRTKYGLDAGTLNGLEKVGTIAVAEHGGDIIVAGLEGLTPVAASSETSTKELIQGIIKRETQTLVSGYIASLYRDATIEKNDILALLDKENTI